MHKGVDFFGTWWCVLVLILQVQCDGELEKVVSHLPSNILDDYSAYRHISIIHFIVPENSVSALFKWVLLLMLLLLLSDMRVIQQYSNMGNLFALDLQRKKKKREDWESASLEMFRFI